MKISLFVSPAYKQSEVTVNFKVWMLDKGIEYNCVDDDLTKYEGGIEELCGGSERIIIIGGSGAIHLVLNLTRMVSIPYGIIPCGTGNDFAVALGISDLPVEEQYHTAVYGVPKAIDTWMVNGTHMFITSLTYGIPAKVNQIHNDGDKAAYEKNVKKVALSYPGARFKITSDKGTIDTQLSVLSVNNTPTIGGGLILDPSARVDDHLMDIMCLQKPNKIRLLLNLLSIKKKGLITQPNATAFRTNKVNIHCYGDAECMIDGEEFKLEDVEIVPGDRIMVALKE